MEETQTNDANISTFCESCCYEPDCPWYGKPLMEYVGDELDKQLTTLHNINQKDNASSGHYQVCVYNDYLLAKDMGLTDDTFEEWYADEGDADNS